MSQGEITVNILTKVEKFDTICNLQKIFEKEFLNLLPHQYRIFHQYDAVRTIKKKMTSNECVLQVDFSENTLVRQQQKIQSMHFGGSRRQISFVTHMSCYTD